LIADEKSFVHYRSSIDPDLPPVGPPLRNHNVLDKLDDIKKEFNVKTLENEKNAAAREQFTSKKRNAEVAAQRALEDDKIYSQLHSNNLINSVGGDSSNVAVRDHRTKIICNLIYHRNEGFRKLYEDHKIKHNLQKKGKIRHCSKICHKDANGQTFQEDLEEHIQKKRAEAKQQCCGLQKSLILGLFYWSIIEPSLVEEEYEELDEGTAQELGMNNRTSLNYTVQCGARLPIFKHTEMGISVQYGYERNHAQICPRQLEHINKDLMETGPFVIPIELDEMIQYEDDLVNDPELNVRPPVWMKRILNLGQWDDFGARMIPPGFGKSHEDLKNFNSGYLRLERSEQECIIGVMKLYVELIHRSGAYNITRPVWCRYLIDTGLVDVESIPAEKKNGNFGKFGIQYYVACCFFDSMAKPVASQNNLMAITDWDAVHITSCLLCLAASVYAAKIEFFERLERMHDKLKQRLEQGPLLTLTIPPISRTAFSKHLVMAAPPSGYTMTEWVQGLRYWTDVFFPDGTEKSEETVLSQANILRERLAEEEYVRNLLIEPEIVHFEHMFRRVFVFLFKAYRDHSFDDNPEAWKTKLHLKSTTYEHGHMSFGSWMHFCKDFRIFPQIASYEDVKHVYKTANCAECKQSNPETVLEQEPKVQEKTDSSSQKDEINPKARATGKTKGKVKGADTKAVPKAKPASRDGSKKDTNSKEGSRPSTGGNRSQTTRSVTPDGKSRPKSSESKNNEKSRPGSPAAKIKPKAKARQPASVPQEDRPEKAISPNYEWLREMSMGNSSMCSDATLLAFDFLRDLNDYLNDRFNKLDNIIIRLQLGTKGILSIPDVHKLIEFTDIYAKDTPALTDLELQAIIKVITQDSDKQLSVFELQRALVRVNELKKPASTAEAPQTFTTSEALFAQINRDVSKMSDPVISDETKCIFNASAFMECLLKIVFKHLCLESGPASPHASISSFHKAIWLLSYLEKSLMKIKPVDETKIQKDKKEKPEFERRDALNKIKVADLNAITNCHSSRSADSRATSVSFGDPEYLFESASNFKRKTKYINPIFRLEWRAFFSHKKDPEVPDEFYKPCIECGREKWFGWGHAQCYKCAITDRIPLNSSGFYPIIQSLVDKLKEECESKENKEISKKNSEHL